LRKSAPRCAATVVRGRVIFHDGMLAAVGQGSLSRIEADVQADAQA
jgi:hypothetical protein